MGRKYNCPDKKGDVTLESMPKILVPDCETMHVVGVEDVKLDTEYKKRFFRCVLWWWRVLLSRI